MSEYKKNHYIPKVVLKNWVTAGSKYDGVHVFDVESKNFSFSTAGGGSGFSFAIVNDLYVPIIEGRRIVDAEKWLSGLENDIGRILPMALAGGEIRYPDQLTPAKFVMGLLSLQYRSEYLLSRFREKVEADSEVQTFLGLNADRSIDQVVVENLVNSVDDFFRKLLPVKMRFLNPKSGEFIITDRPVIEEDILGERILVVGPKLAIALSQGQRHYEYMYMPVDEVFVHQINEFLATQARSWIVGASETIVRKYSDIIGSDRWIKMKNSEKVVTLPFSQLSQGWEFKKKGP